ncbi:hypothetical protein J6590_069711 [Homalodisca vitripennis]|nr:hypothetical protein J6590_069711 [Homalodisca vitripennis]
MEIDLLNLVATRHFLFYLPSGFEKYFNNSDGHSVEINVSKRVLSCGVPVKDCLRRFQFALRVVQEQWSRSRSCYVLL